MSIYVVLSEWTLRGRTWEHYPRLLTEHSFVPEAQRCWFCRNTDTAYLRTSS